MSKSEQTRETKRPVNFWKTYWRILMYLKSRIFLVALCISLSFLIGVLYFGSLGMIQPLMDLLFADGQSEVVVQLRRLGEWGSRIADHLEANLLNDKYRTLYIMMGIVMILTIARNTLRFFQEFIAHYLTVCLTIDVNNQLFAKAKRLPTSFFDMESETKLTSRFAIDVNAMTRGVRSVFNKAFREPMKAIGALVLALLLDWKLALITISAFPLSFFFIKYLSKIIKKSTRKTLEQQGNLLTILQEAFEGIKIVKSYRMENWLQKKFEARNQKLLRYEIKIGLADVAASPVLEAFITTVGIGVLLFSAHLVLSGQMTPGSFCAFYAALAAVLDPVRKLSSLTGVISSSVAAAERVFYLLDMEDEVSRVPATAHLVELPRMQKGIRFDKVCFSYVPDKRVLHDISFSVNHGECVALVGPSGAGKSTLASLIPRLYEIESGGIFIDDRDIRDVTLESLRGQIGLVTQEAFLFHDSVLSNITCGESASREAVEDAAQQAYAHHFIENLPHSYDSLYGEDHIELSGGQKHRIALARSFFKSPAILILDEAMANLDAESESYIKRALEKLTQGRTTFIIAHRFSTIEKADRILVLNRNGCLEGFGPHSEVLNASPTYRNLYEQQIIARI